LIGWIVAPPCEFQRAKITVVHPYEQLAQSHTVRVQNHDGQRDRPVGEGRGCRWPSDAKIEHRDRPANNVHAGRLLKQFVTAWEVRLTQNVAQELSDLSCERSIVR